MNANLLLVSLHTLNFHINICSFTPKTLTSIRIVALRSYHFLKRVENCIKGPGFKPYAFRLIPSALNFLPQRSVRFKCKVLLSKITE
jgi:hypothetical protein